MNPKSNEFLHRIWMNLSEAWRQIDHAIEMYVQQAIDELEEVRQQK